MKGNPYTKQITPAGIKIYLGNEHVKTIPDRYKGVFKKRNILNYTRKRLTQEECFKLEVDLFEKSLRKEQKSVYELIKRSQPRGVRKIELRSGQDYFVLSYKNKIDIKCPQHIYDLGINRLPALKRNY
ncbi:hypothetical protein ACH3O9_11215 [Leeuwenhoekiella sp. A16]|uniref:hypothetical protein n=1 Tax=Leeuwenhoekiella sp. A16 TaxID=3141462 RepID=UPI003A7FC065